MAQDRLTRQELSWLLAQEARSAATALRDGLSHQPPPPDVQITERQPGSHVETTLDALDASISMLTELQKKSPTRRRGRIDLASLLYEVAPSTRITIEPGAGTEVIGDESELRRMLHVLVSQTPGGAETSSAEVKIRRLDDWVKIGVDLGPDTSSTAAMERRWLSRMATRHGGRVELEGGMQSLSLPADGGDQREVEQLRKELEQAQQLGEAYAREIAAAFSAGDLPSPSSLPPGPDEALGRFEQMVTLARALAKPLHAIFKELRHDASTAGDTPGDGASLVRALNHKVSIGYEIVGELKRIAECPVGEESAKVDFLEVARSTVSDASARAARHGVKIELDDTDPVVTNSMSHGAQLLMRAVVDHAIAATPKGGNVVMSVTKQGDAVLIAVEDGGPSIPSAQRNDVTTHRMDPASVGRPAGPALMIASTTAAYLGGLLLLKETPNGASLVEVELPLG